MAREKECQRDVLDRLDCLFPDKELLNSTEVASFLGIYVSTARENLPFKKIGNRYYIAKPVLARNLC